MKAQLFVAMILAIVSVATIPVNAARLGGKGNMRGLAKKFSEFSPLQMMTIKRLLNQRQNEIYFCVNFHIPHLSLSIKISKLQSRKTNSSSSEIKILLFGCDTSLP